MESFRLRNGKNLLIKVKAINNIAIFGHTYQKEFLADIGAFLSLALGRGFSVWIERKFREYLESEGVEVSEDISSFDMLPPDTEAAISLGGDGTFLRTARRVGASGVPVLGINTGHLGFLSHYTFADAPVLLTRLLSGDMRIEAREVLKVTSDLLPADFWPYALNEVAVVKEDTSSMITACVTVDGFFLADYLADGLLISTPTGSTGYNLSVGGPIVEPSMECMIVTPVAPHTLTMRPLVISGRSRVEVRTDSRAVSYRLSLDGCGCLLPAGSKISIEKADFAVNVLLSPNTDFAIPLRNKLLWGVR